MSEGVGQILQGGAVATLTGSGVIGSSKFTGLIECYDFSELLSIPDEIEVVEPDEVIQITPQVPVGANLSATVQVFTLPNVQLIGTIADAARVVNYELAAQRLLEDGETNRVTEDGDVRMTEEEHT